MLATDLHPVPGGVSVIRQTSIQTADTVSAANGIGRQVFASSAGFIPANPKVGDAYTMLVRGSFTTSAAGPNQRPRIDLGGTVLADTGDLGLLLGATNAPWDGYLDFIFRAVGTAGLVESTGLLRFFNGTAPTHVFVGPTGRDANATAGNPAAIDTTVPMLFRLSTQYAMAAGGNSTQVRQLYVTRR